MKYTCRHCGRTIGFPDNEFNGGGSFHPDGEELLWGHIQLQHLDVYKEVQSWETPFMLEECYDKTEEKGM